MVNDIGGSGNETRLRLLCAIEACGGEFVSGEELSRRFSVSRTSIWKQMRVLRAKGYDIESQPRRGYRLISCPEDISALEVRKRLSCSLFGCDIQQLARVASTQQEAFRMAQGGAPAGTVVLAEEQTGGRGRVGRSFFSPPGGLWFSVILRPPLQPQVCLPLSLMAGVAVVESVIGLTGLPAVLKWPNDVLVGGKKVAGILAEMVAETDAVRFVILGIGVNANVPVGAFPVELQSIATSLSAESGKDVSRSRLLCTILENLDRRYADMLSLGAGSVLDAWRKCPNVLGGRVRVNSINEQVQGLALDLDIDGALLVRTDDGTVKRVIVGDVSMNG
ncbi:MAG: biotin--[acetyl-CoA-carboxylase] ligase [Dehalococcoidia bacterium]|nr:biotin--[acetyl-CoA-carboxylase] ligase [Dehalococcoidia bacterium]